ncbi:MAG: c-type cytochrome [Candidatus Sericytochromatia bacterium]
MTRYLPLAVSTALLTWFVSLSAGVQAQSQLAAAPPGSAKKGAALYAQHCALCHGPKGQGDGPVGKSLKPSPRDFSKGVFLYTRTDAERLAFIQAGKGAMPPWGKVLSEAQIRDVIAYIHTLKTPAAK